MATVLDIQQLSPFEALADYERRSLAHTAGLPEQIEAPGLWRGIGFQPSNEGVGGYRPVQYPALTIGRNDERKKP